MKKADESAPAVTETTETAPKEEETVAPPVVKTPEEALKDFEAYVKEYAEANNNKLKDIQKYQSLAIRSQQEVADMERLKIDFNKKQLARYEKAKKLIEEINKVK
ncbi:MAG: hypothetical protein LBP72_06965 [Dysgonamonadaceae bacterium]|nr:hypothetical protein [Dysgonamonadaceae bacterium]